jgi:hypothetical protein
MNAFYTSDAWWESTAGNLSADEPTIRPYIEHQGDSYFDLIMRIRPRRSAR